MSKKTRLRLACAIMLGTLGGISVGCSDDAIAPPVRNVGGPVIGDLAVIANTTGLASDPDGYEVLVDGRIPWVIGVNESLTLSDLAVGDHVLQLRGVAPNCAVDGDNPRTVTVTGSATSGTTFYVICEATTGIAIVSGDAQSVKAGRLGEPLVVRVTTRDGTPVGDAEVIWAAGAQEVLLVDEGRVVDDENAYAETATRTSADGLAQMSFIPASFAVVTVSARVSACPSGCGESGVSFSADARESGATLEMVSGAVQAAKAGRLGEPLVVRVADGLGEPVPHAAVHWGIKYGDGALQGSLDEGGGPLTYALTHTDADGLVALTVMPLWFGPVDVEASVGAVEGSPALFTMDATDLGVSLTMVSGNDQQGKAGEALAEPFVVQVVDGTGEPVPNVLVHWRIAGQSNTHPGPTYTGTDGLASLYFSPRRLGGTRVNAELPGLPRRATFDLDANGVVISYDPAEEGWPNFFGTSFDGWACDWSACWLYVPVGTTVEWVSHVPAARIVSTSAPAGGTPVDSGPLLEGERVQFVPGVAGTWLIEDALAESWPLALIAQ